MYTFSRYFSELMSQIGSRLYDILIAFRDLFVDLWHSLYAIFSDMATFTSSYMNSFDGLSWVLFGLVVLVLLAILFGIGYGIYRLIRRRVKIKTKYSTKAKMMDEIEDLNEKVLDLIDEKNRIMAMKVSQLGIKPGSKGADALKKNDKDWDKRFIKLNYVDRMNEKKEYQTMKEEDKIDLATLTIRFRHYSAGKLGLYYTDKSIQLFLAGLGAAKILILEGISGTGKTSLPYAFGMFFQNKSSIISVQPSWRDRSELLGYLNEFTKKFNESEFLKEMYKANYEKEPRIIVLDEMNLARIEYYFAEFLSMMEMPNPDDRVIDLVSERMDNDPKFLQEGKLVVPKNIWFLGTANQDDSTFAVTDKVYDRAVSIVFNRRAEVFKASDEKPIYMEYEYLQKMFDDAIENQPVSKESLEKLEEIEQFMISKFKLPFGNRIYLQINKFVPVFKACGGSEVDGLDYIFMRKVLRKMSSLHIGFVQREMKGLVTLIEKLFGKTGFYESKEFIEDLMKQM